MRLEAVDYDAPASELNEDACLLRDFIKEDPEGLLQETTVNYVNKSTQVKESLSLQHILLQRLDGKTWEEIAVEDGITITSASSFLQRNLRKEKIRAYFSTYLG
jgi:hypothetical protein